MRAQATRWGARCLDEDVEAVDVEAVDVEAVDVEAVDATSTPVVISLVGGGEVQMPRRDTRRLERLRRVYVGGRAPASGGVFATDPTAVDERSAGPRRRRRRGAVDQVQRRLPVGERESGGRERRVERARRVKRDLRFDDGRRREAPRAARAGRREAKARRGGEHRGGECR